MAALNTPLYCTCGYHDRNRHSTYVYDTDGCICDYTCTSTAPDKEEYSNRVINYLTSCYDPDAHLKEIFRRAEKSIRTLKFRAVHVCIAQRHRQALANSHRRQIAMPQSSKILPRTVHNAMMLARAKEN